MLTMHNSRSEMNKGEWFLDSDSLCELMDYFSDPPSDDDLVRMALNEFISRIRAERERPGQDSGSLLIKPSKVRNWESVMESAIEDMDIATVHRSRPGWRWGIVSFLGRLLIKKRDKPCNKTP